MQHERHEDHEDTIRTEQTRRAKRDEEQPTAKSRVREERLVVSIDPWFCVLSHAARNV